MGEFRTNDQTYFQQACDMGSIWNILFFGSSTPQVEQAPPSYNHNVEISPTGQHTIQGDSFNNNREIEDARRRQQEEEFKQWLAVKYPPIQSNANGASPHGNPNKLSPRQLIPKSNADTTDADREKAIEEARRKHREAEIFRLQKENEFKNYKQKAESNAPAAQPSVWGDITRTIGFDSLLSTPATTASNSPLRSPAPANNGTNNGTLRAHSSYSLISSQPSHLSTFSNNSTSSNNNGYNNYYNNGSQTPGGSSMSKPPLYPSASQSSHNEAESGDKFERLLDTQGVPVTLQLPRNNTLKSKKAILRCDKDSSCISVEVISKHNNATNMTKIKKLKFEIKEILMIAKGKGASIAFDRSIDDSCIMRFIIHEKPELNIELDDANIRDAVVAGLMGMISRRRARMTSY